MKQTLDLALELNTEMANMYPCQALPGSPLYNNAILNGDKVPEKYEEFSFHSYETIPLPTNYLKAHEILELRDRKFIEYFQRPEFIKKIKGKFGDEAIKNISDMTKIKLKRKIIEENSKIQFKN